MTPEEWTEKLLPEEELISLRDERLRKKITNAIRAAIAEERERCAKIAEATKEGNWMYNDEQGSYWESDAEKTRQAIATRIRSGEST